MRKKILKVFFVILTGITVTLTGCELSGSNESAQTESESGKDAVKFIPNLTTAVTRKPTPTAVAANPGDSVQNQQSGNNAEAEIYQSQGDPADQESAQEETYQSQGDPADQESAQEETYDIQYITGNILYSDENTITVEVGESGNYYNMVFNIENAVLNIANGSAVRSGLNVDLEYYSQNNVNIVIMLTSDGEEYLPSSTLEEAQKMADEYVPDVSESENEDFEDTSPSEY
ncbi:MULTISPECIES: hypothetical protein [Blautia]|nr:MULTISPECIES: hypothetical protein [Blautia]NSG20765.1 hypothetical protein [Blautia obeum]RGG58601.1 hypothetical protein DWX28_16480 [Blautia sp. AF19-10LB]